MSEIQKSYIEAKKNYFAVKKVLNDIKTEIKKWNEGGCTYPLSFNATDNIENIIIDFDIDKDHIHQILLEDEQ